MALCLPNAYKGACFFELVSNIIHNNIVKGGALLSLSFILGYG